MQGVQNIISGWQTMTVFKDVRKLATATAAAAVRIIKGKKPRRRARSRQGSQPRAGVPDPAADDHQVELADLSRRAVSSRGARSAAASYKQYCSSRRSREWRRPLGRLHSYSCHGRQLMSDQPLLELRGVSKSFGSVQALTDVDFEVRCRRGHGARRRQRRRQVDADQVRRRHPRDGRWRDRLRRRAGLDQRAEGRGASSGSRSSTRTSRSATTSTSSRTCTSGARPRLVDPAQGASDGGEDARDARRALA